MRSAIDGDILKTIASRKTRLSDGLVVIVIVGSAEFLEGKVPGLLSALILPGSGRALERWRRKDRPSELLADASLGSPRFGLEASIALHKLRVRRRELS